MRVIEQLLGMQADDTKSPLDETHVTRLLHVIRAQGGEHGGALADALTRSVGPETKTKTEPAK